MSVLILLATYNGDKYLKEQLDSLKLQTYKDFDIIIRDDNSTDDTISIANFYNIKVVESEYKLGAKGSFGALMEYALQNSDAEYFMFCDQDDVWVNDKIEKTLAKMHTLEKEHGSMPFLVHTDLEVVDEKLGLINNSFMNFQKINPSKNKLNELLLQNTITGCTVMINRELAKKSFSMPSTAIMHDWWIGLIASKFGKIEYINESLIKYRQHDKNTIGAKGFSYFEIIKKGVTLNHKIKINDNLLQAKAFLEIFENELDVKTKTMLTEFIMLEQKTFWQKRAVLWKYRLLKQGFIRNVGLFLKI